MKILMSAFACAPNSGSEPGVGWSWALEAAKLGYPVTVLTQICDRDAIEERVQAGQTPENLKFEFFMPTWLERLRQAGMRTGFEGPTWLVVNVLWQICAYLHLRRRDLSSEFDVIHHITYGGIRHPTLLGLLNVPLVLGPLGGGERAPMALRQSLRWRDWVAELVRDIHTWTLRFDPITRQACRKAIAIFAKTAESVRALPVPKGKPVHVHSEIGTHQPAKAPQARAVKREGPLRLIYLGRFLYWKGLAFGIRAIAEARQRGLDVRLTMVGAGPEEANWRRLSADLGVEDCIEWKGYIPHEQLGEVYRAHDALLFPSLHDSSGNVVLESFVHGLPVVCLKLGGPATLVNEMCGRVVDVEHKSEAEVVAGLADAIEELASGPEVIDRLSRSAVERARRYSWADVVRGLYTDVELRLGRQAIFRPAE